MLPVRASAPPTATTTWNDEYTDLGDRVDQPPLPLPAIAKPVRVTIVRHGQSTWNAESRVQGSSNQSVLSEKGKQQARASQAMVSEALVLGQSAVTNSTAWQHQRCGRVVCVDEAYTSLQHTIAAHRHQHCNTNHCIECICVQLKDQRFDHLYVSPLARARETADIIWEGRAPVKRHEPPVLREIDLYSFQAGSPAAGSRRALLRHTLLAAW